MTDCNMENKKTRHAASKHKRVLVVLCGLSRG